MPAARRRLTAALDPALAALAPTWACAWARRRLVRDPVRAVPLLAAIAARAPRPAAVHLGDCYREGRGVPQHLPSAAFWYQRAAALGDARAACRLAQLCLTGHGAGAADQPPPLLDPPGLAEPDYAAARHWAEQAAQAGDAEAQAVLGFLLAHGPAAMRDPAASEAWYARAAAQDLPRGRLGLALSLILRHADDGDWQRARHELGLAAAAGLADAHYLLGLSAEAGLGTGVDAAEARRHYATAAAGGIVAAQARLGFMLLDGLGGPPNRQEAETWLRRAALAGHAEAAVLVGSFYSGDGPLPPNYAEAMAWFRAAAEAGHGGAAHHLGLFYLQGAGGLRDTETAAGWLKHAAEQGDAMACFNYAVCLINGIGVPADVPQAARLLARAAETLPLAQYWHGRLLAEGQGVPRDEAAACACFTRAAQAGIAEAQLALADCHLHGRGVPRDVARAEAWLLEAAAQGQAGAFFTLGLLHAGEGGHAVDRTQAGHWFARAAAAGHPLAPRMMEIIAQDAAVPP